MADNSQNVTLPVNPPTGNIASSFNRAAIPEIDTMIISLPSGSAEELMKIKRLIKENVKNDLPLKIRMIING